MSTIKSHVFLIFIGFSLCACGGGSSKPRVAPQENARSEEFVDWAPGEALYGVATEQNVEVITDDGIVLRVDVYYPADPESEEPIVGQFPSLLTQTPYGKSTPGLSTGDDINYLVERGYIAVVADVRGRGASQGSFGLWDEREARDGVLLADWAAKLPNSNGKVGLFGASYLGITQIMTAAAAGPNSPIKAIAPQVAISDVARDGLYGGMPNGGFGLLYAVLFPGTGLAGLPGYMGLEEPLDLSVRTLSTIETSSMFSNRLVQDMVLDGPSTYVGDFWDPRSPFYRLEGLAANRIPTMLIGGFYDIMGFGPYRNYVALQNLVAGRPARYGMTAGQSVDPLFQLVMGPWTHAGTLTPMTQQMRLQWFDRWLKDVRSGIEHTASPVKFNIMNTDRWVETDIWPPKEATVKTFYLGEPSDSGAPSLNDGSLSLNPPATATGFDQVPWSGVSSPCSVRLRIQSAGLAEMTGLPADDVCGSGSEATTQIVALTYTTEPFAEDTIIAGNVAMTLYAASTTKNAEFIIGLSRVLEDGTPVSITSGAMIASKRALIDEFAWHKDEKLVMPVQVLTPAANQDLVPNEVTQFDIAIWPTVYQINAGERLRVTISTSDIPFALPSLPMIEQLVGGIYDIQRNALYPSHINIPIARYSDFKASCGVCALIE